MTSDDIFEGIYAEYADRIYGVVYRVVRDHALAEDVAQETWLKVARCLDTFRADSKLSTWLYRVAQRTAFDALRARKAPCRSGSTVDVSAATEVPCPLPSPEEQFLSAERSQRLGRAIASLSPVYRDAIQLAAMGMSGKDAAFTLGIPVETFKSRNFRARQALAASWTP